ncbi:MAG TPA: MFS transporter [Candidatus Saccharimonadia bacterium]
MPERSVAGNARIMNWFLWWFCLRFYAATMVVYFAKVTGSLFLAASLLVVIQVAQAVLEVPTGLVSDRLGRVWCVRLQAVASLSSVGCYAVGAGYGWLAVGAVFDGLWRALMSGNNEALVYESARENGQGGRFPHYLASMNVAMEAGGFISMALGGLLAAIGFHWALWATMLMSLPALVASLWLVEPARHEAPRVVSAWGHFREAVGLMWRSHIIRRLSLAQILEDGCSTFALWPALYQQFMPLGLVGAMYSVNFLESAVGFRASGWFLRRFKPGQIILGGELYAKALFLPALIFPSPITPALMALAGASYGPMTVALGKVLHEEYTDHQRATIGSITSFVGNCLYAVFTLGIGLAADRWGVGRAILLGQLCLLPRAWLYWRTRRL